MLYYVSFIFIRLSKYLTDVYTDIWILWMTLNSYASQDVFILRFAIDFVSDL